MKRYLIVVAMTLVAVLAGCASTGKPSASAAGVHKIALLSIPQPQRPRINNFGNPGAAFGAIGAAAVSASSAEANKDPFIAMLNEAQFDFSREMEAALIKALRQKGYEVSVIKAERKNTLTTLDDYSAFAQANADAVLDVTNRLYFGYSNVDLFDRKFRPHLNVLVRMANPKTGEVYYADEFLYGYTNPFAGGRKLPSPQQYFFDDANAIFTHKAEAVAGLRAGIDTIARQTADTLKQ